MLERQLIFASGREHFIRYQKANDARANASTAARMSAYVTETSTARLPKPGDVVWVLARVGEASPAQCRFAYAFVVDQGPTSRDGRRELVGSRGIWMPDSELVSHQPWFKELFDTLGRGGISIQALSSAWVARLKELFGVHDAEAADPDSAPDEQDRLHDWPQDALALRTIRERRGQVEFRRRLLEAYGRRCCISGCRVEPLLEAAHIRPHAVEPNYDVWNGLLLRADLHTLFDLHLLAVDVGGRLHLSRRVNDPAYRDLVERVRYVTPPDRSVDRPRDQGLIERMALFVRE